MLMRFKIYLLWKRILDGQTILLGNYSMKQSEMQPSFSVIFLGVGLNWNCSFATMNYNELSALSGAAQSGLDDLGTKPEMQTKMSEQENKILCNISSFFGMLTGTRTNRETGATPKPLTALRMMTTGDQAGRSF